MKGLVYIYTGDGKGKTTSAFGMAIRTAAYGRKVYIAQFMKGMPYGENIYLKDDMNIEIEQFGWDKCIRKKDVNQEHKQIIENGLIVCKEKMISQAYEMIILDEIIVAVWFDRRTESHGFY